MTYGVFDMKKSRLNVEPSLEDLDSWWGKMDVHTKNWIKRIAENKISIGKASDEVQDIENYIRKRKEFLRDLPRTLVKEWGVGRTVMTYESHTKDAVFYTVTQETASDVRNPVFDENRVVRDKKVVALFYTHVGKRKSKPHPVAKKSETSDRLHALCGTNPAMKHMVIEDKRDRVAYANSCWCNKFLWELGFPVNEKF